MGPKRVDRPAPVIAIACFQFAKGAFLLTVAAFLAFAPDSLPYTRLFSQLFFIAARGRNVSGVLVPLLGLYLIHIGVQLLRLRPTTRRNLAISSAITIVLSLQRLGVFGDSDMRSNFDHEALYIVILADLTVYIYLAFHPEILRIFKRKP
jgi:hypothetical protein